MNEEQMVAEVLHGEAAADSSRYALYENGTYMVSFQSSHISSVCPPVFLKMNMSHRKWSGIRNSSRTKMLGLFGTCVCYEQHSNAITRIFIRPCVMI